LVPARLPFSLALIGGHPTAEPRINTHASTSEEIDMAEQESQLPKPKKSVALSGTAAGNTALCTVGRTGNDLHYRGYDILDFADHAEFEEIAHLLIHGHLPTRSELIAYKNRLSSLRGLPASLKLSL